MGTISSFAAWDEMVNAVLEMKARILGLDSGTSNTHSLELTEQIRRQPGMYVGPHETGIYVLLKAVVENSIDEFIKGFGNRIEITIGTNPDRTQTVTVRDFGRGILLDKILDCPRNLNAESKYDGESCDSSEDLNGISLKFLNALSRKFIIKSFRDDKTRCVEFSKGVLVKHARIKPAPGEKFGTWISFTPDPEIFPNYEYQEEVVEKALWFIAHLNMGLTLTCNEKMFKSQNGILDLLNQSINGETSYSPVDYRDPNKLLDVAFTHAAQSGADYYSFTNGQYTSDGGTHQQAFQEAIVQVLREFYKKDYDASDILSGIVASISIRIQEPQFESQTKIKLASTHISPKGGVTIKTFIYDLLKNELDNYLHRNQNTAEILEKRILRNERERIGNEGIR